MRPEVPEPDIKCTRTEYFDDVVKITKDMPDLAKHLVQKKSEHFEPEKCEDHHESTFQQLHAKKQHGQPTAPTRNPVAATSSRVAASIKPLAH